jgi:lysophospholipase L1-like esterase
MNRSLRTALALVVALGVGVLIYLAVTPKTQPSYAAGAPFHPVAAAGAPTQPSSLWIGDSYTQGVGAVDQSHAESCLTSTAMGWVCNTDAEGGTGFIANGRVTDPTYAPVGRRLAADKANLLADVVIVDAGRNDSTLPEPKLEHAADREFAGIRKDWPKAQLVAIVPYFMNATGRTAAFAAFERAEMVKYHGQVVDPIAEGWISAKTASMTIADRVHPTPAGHRYIAQHLVADFRRLGLAKLPVTDI